MTTGKTIALTRWTFVGKVTSLLFNMLSRLVVTFLPRSKHLLTSWLQSSSAVNLEPPKIKSETVSTVSPSISHEVMGPDENETKRKIIYNKLNLYFNMQLVGQNQSRRLKKLDACVKNQVSYKCWLTQVMWWCHVIFLIVNFPVKQTTIFLHGLEKSTFIWNMQNTPYV